MHNALNMTVLTVTASTRRFRIERTHQHCDRARQHDIRQRQTQQPTARQRRGAPSSKPGARTAITIRREARSADIAIRAGDARTWPAATRRMKWSARPRHASSARSASQSGTKAAFSAPSASSRRNKLSTATRRRMRPQTARRRAGLRSPASRTKAEQPRHERAAADGGDIACKRHRVIPLARHSKPVVHRPSRHTCAVTCRGAFARYSARAIHEDKA